MRTLVTADRLWTGSEYLDQPQLLIEDGRISFIASRATTPEPAADSRIDFSGNTISPAFFDVHIHGAAGHDVMEATPSALSAVGRFLASRGTGSYLATTVTAPLDKTLHSLSGLAKLLNAPADPTEARPIGIHLEGPFISHARRGVHPPAYILAPNIATLDQMIDAAGGHARLITLAPELPGATEFAAHAIARGLRVSIGHSNATAAECLPAIAAGATSATHTFNAMRPLDHREPSILSTVLNNDNLFAELICDGIHVSPEIVKIWWRMKGRNRGILVTDAMSAAGMPDGTYQLGGFDVQVANGKATADGVLAGSVLTLDRALENFITFTGATLDDALRLLTLNPATMTGFVHQTASLAPGLPANILAINKKGQRIASLQNGILI
jgi:N-acetylglucosamine-6-phosphate deacetylase